MKRKEFIKNEKYDEVYDDSRFSPIKYIWLTNNKILLDISQNNKENRYKNDKIDLYLIDLDKDLQPTFLITIDINQPHDLLKQTNDKIIFGNTDYENRITTIYNYNLKTQNLSKIMDFNGLQQGLSPKISPDGKQMIATYDYEHENFDFIDDLIVISLTVWLVISNPV